MLRSKRRSLRINCQKREVRIRTNYEEGTAVLINISTKGCAVVESSLDPEIGEVVLISFSIEGGYGETSLIEIQAKILRKEPQMAMQFTRIEPETESLILKFFLAEARALKKEEAIH